MQALGITLDELLEVVRTCEPVAIEHRTPPYLQNFIATRLADRFPELAGKVLGWDAAQMDALCALIQDVYTLLRGTG